MPAPAKPAPAVPLQSQIQHVISGGPDAWAPILATVVHWLLNLAAAGILVIIGGGGAFGAILAKADIGSHIAQNQSIAAMGLFLPFLVTALLKTAQGSSTVAIIAAAAIMQPLLPVTVST